MAKRDLGFRARLVELHKQHPDPMPPDDEEAQKRWPLLWDLLTSQLSRGKDQLCDQAFITVRMGDGCFVVTISDPATAQTAQVEAPNLPALLDVVESKLGNGALRWARSRRRKPQIQIPKT